MNILDAAILGIIEGLTEFIPVSSTGHLIIANRFLNLDGDVVKSFDIFVQSGAILAVVILYFDRFRSLCDFKSKTGFVGTMGITRIILACLPALICGAIFHAWIKDNLFNPGTVAIALIFGGAAMILVELRAPQVKLDSLDQLTTRHALLLGLIQVASLWAGISRSGSMILGGMLLGINRKVAAEFSFIVAVPVMFAATGYELLKNFGAIGAESLGAFVVGFITAFVTAVCAIKLFITVLNRITLSPFGVYRIIVGALILLLQ